MLQEKKSKRNSKDAMKCFKVGDQVRYKSYRNSKYGWGDGIVNPQIVRCIKLKDHVGNIRST